MCRRPSSVCAWRCDTWCYASFGGLATPLGPPRRLSPIPRLAIHVSASRHTASDVMPLFPLLLSLFPFSLWSGLSRHAIPLAFSAPSAVFLQRPPFLYSNHALSCFTKSSLAIALPGFHSVFVICHFPRRFMIWQERKHRVRSRRMGLRQSSSSRSISVVIGLPRAFSSFEKDSIMTRLWFLSAI